VTIGLWIAVAAVAVALVFGGYRLLTDGHFRGTRRLRRTDASDEPAATPLIPDVELGERATLVQFSSAFCAPCRATRRILTEVADAVPGVTHVELDAEANLELVRTLGVLRTPTTIVLDACGQEVTRAVGAPRKSQVLDSLSHHLG